MEIMKKILFFIPTLHQGGAEKVLVNLVNNLDRRKFDITLITLFGGGINEQFLNKDIRYKYVFPRVILGNSQWLKLFSPRFLHNAFIKDHYDIEVSYLEGVAARIISGCTNRKTKLVSWIHVEQHNLKKVSYSFRTVDEAMKCYNRFDQIICVSNYVMNDFSSITNTSKPICVLYNTVESEIIKKKAAERLPNPFDRSKINLIAVGTLKKSKGYLRLFTVIKTLFNEGYPIHLYVLGDGPQKDELCKFINENELKNTISLLGYDLNPYKYVANADLFVCSSFAEGFSTAVSESLIVGTPVCTVEVSGMKELLGDNNEYGIVTENSEDGLLSGLKQLLDDKNLLKYYAEKAVVRGTMFETQNTVSAVEKMLQNISEAN